MPRSFLITKLHGRKDDEVAEDDTASSADDAAQANDACTEHSGVVGRTLQVPSLSTKHSDVSSGISAVGDKTDGENFWENFSGMSTLANLH